MPKFGIYFKDFATIKLNKCWTPFCGIRSKAQMRFHLEVFDWWSLHANMSRISNLGHDPQNTKAQYPANNTREAYPCWTEIVKSDCCDWARKEKHQEVCVHPSTWDLQMTHILFQKMRHQNLILSLLVLPKYQEEEALQQTNIHFQLSCHKPKRF